MAFSSKHTNIAKMVYKLQQSHILDRSMRQWNQEKVSQSHLHNIQLTSSNMAASQPKQNLPNLLKKISLKLNSLFLQKLVLLEQQKLDYKNVRHYDLECEGLEGLVGFFKNKQQNLLYKAFTSIRDGRTYSNDKATLLNHKPNETTRRTFLNTTFTASQCSPIKKMFCHTIRSQRSSKAQSNTAKSQLNKTSTNLQHLLNRVKLANSKQEGIYSFRQTNKSNNNDEVRQNFSYYISNKCNTPKTIHQQQRHKTNPSNLDQNDLNYYSFYKSQMISTRNSRRQFIMDKFNQIQNQLHVLNNKKQSKEPQLSKQILNEIDTIKQRFKLQL